MYLSKILTSNELLTLPNSPNEKPNNYITFYTKSSTMQTKQMPSKTSNYKHKKTTWTTSSIIKYIQYGDTLNKKPKTTNHNAILFVLLLR